MAGRGLTLPLVALAMVFTANCGGGGNSQNPPPPVVVIDAESQFVDVGQRYFLDGSQTTDPDGDFEDIQFQWRLIRGGLDTVFDDHCREDFDEICFSNDDDHCSTDTDIFCDDDDDCPGLQTCLLNSGTTSPDCTIGICGIGEGNDGVEATMLANVAGPFTVRLTAVGAQANGTKNKVLDTYPSLFVVGSLIEFGGTGGALVGEVADAAEFASGAIRGAGIPTSGNLLVIDGDLGLLREFDLHGGTITGPFGESDNFLVDPTALTFHPDNQRLYAAEAGGRVLIFDGTTGLLITSFGNVGANPVALRFSPVSGDLLVVDGQPGAGVKAFDTNGNAKGVLGDTDTAVSEAVDLDFLPESNRLLIADRTGKVVACDADGTDCGQFSAGADNLLSAGSPSAIAINPSYDSTSADVLIADPVGERVIACNLNGSGCGTFGETDEIDSEFSDVFFSPTSAPTTTTTSSTTTTLPEN